MKASFSKALLQGGWRRPLAFLPPLLVAMMPKCPLCLAGWAGWLGLGGVAFSGAAYGLVGIHLLWIAWRSASQRVFGPLLWSLAGAGVLLAGRGMGATAWTLWGGVALMGIGAYLSTRSGGACRLVAREEEV